MFSSITNFSSKSDTLFRYTDYKMYQTAINSGYKQICRELSNTHILDSILLPNTLNKARTFLLDNKEWIIGGVAITAVSLIAVNFFRNQIHYPIVEMESSFEDPIQYPVVKMESSLNHALISIESTKHKILNLTQSKLVFCIDISGSMKGQRETEVKEGVNQVLNSALKFLEKANNSTIEIAIILFNKTANTICKPTLINSQNIDKIKKELKGYTSDGDTNILAGLETSTLELENMVFKDKKASATLVFLTDGGNSINSSAINAIHDRLSAINAKLFAIGIGEHDRKTLEIIAPKAGKFTGTYLDTTLGNTSITDTISDIYKQSLASFHDFSLRSSQLSAGTWSIGNVFSISSDNQSKCPLWALSQENKIEEKIQIHSNKLETPLDLSEISFELTFTDPNGKEGSLSLPWKPNSIMDPRILNYSL